MAIQQDMGAVETTIASVASSVRNDLRELQEGLETFLRVSVKESINKPTPFADPIAETIAILQDCRTLVLDIRQLAIEKIAKRIID